VADSVDDLMKRLDDLGGDALAALEKGLLQAAKLVQGEAKKLAPVNTGELRERIFTSVHRDGADLVAEVAATAPHSVYVEFGTGPEGQKSPKDLPPDVNPTYRQDGWVYRREDTGEFVHTEGQPAKPFLYPAFKMHEHELQGVIADVLMQEMRKAGQA